MSLGKRQKFFILAGIAGASATTLLALMPRSEVASASTGVDPLKIMRAGSPGARPPGAQTNKRFSASLATSTPPVRSFSPLPFAPVTSEVRPAAMPTPAILASAVPGDALPAAVTSAPAGTSASGLLPVVGALAGAGAIFAANNGGGSGGFAPATPEPSTWLMIITGFAFLGIVLRRQRRKLTRLVQIGNRG
jgi:hypothetical protein